MVKHQRAARALIKGSGAIIMVFGGVEVVGLSSTQLDQVTSQVADAVGPAVSRKKTALAVRSDALTAWVKGCFTCLAACRNWAGLHPTSTVAVSPTLPPSDLQWRAATLDPLGM